MQHLIDLARSTSVVLETSVNKNVAKFFEVAFQDETFKELATSVGLTPQSAPRILGSYGIVASEDFLDEQSKVNFRLVIGFYDNVIRLMIEYYDNEARVYNPVADSYITMDYEPGSIAVAVTLLQNRAIGFFVANREILN